jgi:hypothetical protein
MRAGMLFQMDRRRHDINNSLDEFCFLDIRSSLITALKFRAAEAVTIV